jgi:tetratricopeptide (TPR) repeat protein
MSTQTTTETFPEIAVPINPFPGLRPFEFDESHLFFGREGQSEQLIGKLGRTHFLAVVGTSGSGKSSLVRAGLLPSLLGGFMTGAGSAWRVAIMRPGNDPIGNLARALNAPDVFGSDIPENLAIQTAMAEATLRRGSLGLVDAVSQAVMPGDENLLVVVDQFEEIFRFARVAEGETYSNEAAGFVKLVIEASRQRKIPIYVVLTMRSDYLGDCSQFWGLPEAINESQYLIPRLTRDQLREAITGPVAVGGGQITPRLVNRLLNDVGDNQDQLPVLQHLLMRVWDESKEKRLTLEVDPTNPAITRPHREVHQGDAIDLCCSDAVGGMSEALSRHADEAYNELADDEDRVVAEKLFKALTEKGADNREIRRPITLGQICAATGAGVAAVVAVIETFRQPGRSFLMPPVGTALNSESLIDISHESLIRGWTRLKGWVAEEALSARIYRRLAETAVLYREGGAGLWRDPDLQIALTWRDQSNPNATWAQRYHPEFALAMSFLDASVAERDAQLASNEARRKKEIKRTRLTAAVFAVAFLFSMGTGAYAYVQKVRAQNALEGAKKSEAKADDRARDADIQRVAAFAAKREAADRAVEAEKQTGLALDAKRQAEADKTTAISASELAAKRAVETAEAQSVAAQERENALRLREETQVQTILLSGFDDLAVANYEGAASSLEKALLYFKEKKDIPKTVSTYLNLGGVYREAFRADKTGSRDGSDAVKSYDQAIDLIRTGAGDQQLLASTMENAASVWAESASPDQQKQSFEYYKQAAAVDHILGKKDDEAARFIDAGKVFSRSDDAESIATSREAFALAVRVYAEPADQKKMAETNVAIGELYEKTLERESHEGQNPFDLTGEGDITLDRQAAAIERQRLLAEKTLHENRLRSTAADYFLAAAKNYDNVNAPERFTLMLRAASILSQSETQQLKEQAAAMFSETADKFKAVKDVEGLTGALISAGDVFREAKDKNLWGRADSYYELAVKVYRDSGEKQDEAKTLGEIANYYGTSDDPGQKRKAVGYYERAYALYVETKNQSSQVSVLLAAARVLENVDDKDAQAEAVAFYNRAVAVYESDFHKQVTMLVGIGRYLVRANDGGPLSQDDQARAARAATYFKQAVALAEKNGGKKEAAAAYTEIGVAYQGKRQFRNAITNFETSRTIYKELNDTVGLGMSLYRLAVLYDAASATKAQAQELADQSLALLGQQLPALESSGDTKALAEAHYGMGYLYKWLKKDYEKALVSYTSALPLYQKLPGQAVRVRSIQTTIAGLKGVLKAKPRAQ